MLHLIFEISLVTGTHCFLVVIVMSNFFNQNIFACDDSPSFNCGSVCFNHPSAGPRQAQSEVTDEAKVPRCTRDQWVTLGIRSIPGQNLVVAMVGKNKRPRQFRVIFGDLGRPRRRQASVMGLLKMAQEIEELWAVPGFGQIRSATSSHSSLVC